MLEKLLSQEEGKTLEFKENTKSLSKIIQTIIGFANTAGGTLVIGIKDKTKEIIGLDNILQEEEKLANAIANSISPLVSPPFQMITYRDKDILVITVPHCYGPYYLTSKGEDKGTFIRLGSTNRLADHALIEEIRRSREKKYFDELPCLHSQVEDLDLALAKKLFSKVKKRFNQKTAQSLGIIAHYQGKTFPTNGGILLFGINPEEFFPNAIIRLVRFAGTTKTEALDFLDLDVPLVTAIDPIISFIRRNTAMAARIRGIRRENIPQYQPIVVREAVTNAILHADYTIRGSHIQIAIFDDRIEITNPGALPLGLDLTTALSGVSQLRNKVFGRVFRELDYIEQWGSGLGRMINLCKEEGIQPPTFEELGRFFRVTLYHEPEKEFSEAKWNEALKAHFKKNKHISAKEAQHLWNVSQRTASERLKRLINTGALSEISTSPYDPYKIFIPTKR